MNRVAEYVGYVTMAAAGAVILLNAWQMILKAIWDKACTSADFVRIFNMYIRDKRHKASGGLLTPEDVGIAVQDRDAV